MKTTKIISLLFTMSVSSIALVAQNKGGNEKITSASNDYVNKLALDIQLTDSQKIKLKKVVFDYYSELTDQKTNSRSTKQAEIQLIEQKFNLCRDSILTPTQKDAIITEENRRGNEASTKNSNKQSK